jgi:hypothetical protein
MTKYTNIDKAACQKFRAELDVLLAKFAEESGLKISLGAMKYTGSTIEFKGEAIIEGGKSIRDQQREANLGFYLTHFNLVKENPLYELVGYDTRKSKNPFIVRKKSDNKQYIMTEEMAKYHFRKAA